MSSAGSVPRSWGEACRERGGGGDLGYLTLQYVVAIGLSLVVLAALANLLVFGYARGVVRAALDEGARAASRADASAAVCRQRADDVLGDLLAGRLGDGVAVECVRSDQRVTASGTATFRAWAPFVPDWSFTASAEAMAESSP